jgi:hypothetical protein
MLSHLEAVILIEISSTYQIVCFALHQVYRQLERARPRSGQALSHRPDPGQALSHCAQLSLTASLPVILLVNAAGTAWSRTDALCSSKPVAPRLILTTANNRLFLLCAQSGSFSLFFIGIILKSKVSLYHPVRGSEDGLPELRSCPTLCCVSHQRFGWTQRLDVSSMLGIDACVHQGKLKCVPYMNVPPACVHTPPPADKCL